jgi:hypothetical protein
MKHHDNMSIRTFVYDLGKCEEPKEMLAVELAVITLVGSRRVRHHSTCFDRQ